MEEVDADHRIEELYNEMFNVIDMSRVVRGEFKKVNLKIDTPLFSFSWNFGLLRRD